MATDRPVVFGLGGDGEGMVMEHGGDDGDEAMHGGDDGDQKKPTGDRSRPAVGVVVAFKGRYVT